MARRTRTKSSSAGRKPRHSGRSSTAPTEHPIVVAHRALAEASHARKSGQLKRSLKLYKQLLQQHPDYVAALHERGIAQMAERDYEAALSSFIRATMLNPSDWTTLASLAQCYVQLGALEMAARTMEQAKTFNSDDAEVHFTLGTIYEAQREYEAAVDSFRLALENNPKHVGAANLLGSCLVHVGDLTGAAQALYQAHLANPTEIAPVAASAGLPADVSLIDVDKAMQSVERDETIDTDANEIRESFTKANTLNKSGNHQEFWEQLMEANGLVYKTILPLVESRKVYRQQMTMLAKQAFSNITPAASDPALPDSLFILGISRSGKTTLERIVGDMPGVKRGYENPIVELAMRRASQRAGLLTIGSLLDLPRELGGDFTRNYVAELKKRSGDAKIFTNTHPGRVSEVGVIAQLVPNAKFLFVYRNREDTLLRILMKQYKQGTNAYAYSVKDALAEIDWYHGLMNHWHAQLPDYSRIVHFEELVEDAALPNRVMKDLCGIETDAVPRIKMPDDRDCSAPYREYFKL